MRGQSHRAGDGDGKQSWDKSETSDPVLLQLSHLPPSQEVTKALRT